MVGGGGDEWGSFRRTAINVLVLQSMVRTHDKGGVNTVSEQLLIKCKQNGHNGPLHQNNITYGAGRSEGRKRGDWGEVGSRVDFVSKLTVRLLGISACIMIFVVVTIVACVCLQVMQEKGKVMCYENRKGIVLMVNLNGNEKREKRSCAYLNIKSGGLRMCNPHLHHRAEG